MNLYDIAHDYRLLADKLLDSDLDEDTKRDTLEAIGGDLETKGRNIGFLIRQLESEADMADAEAKRIQALAKARKNAVERLKDWLLLGLQTAGMDEIKTTVFTIKLRLNPPSVIVNNADLIPKKFLRVIPAQKEPDKQAIAIALKEGKKVAGCHLERKQSLSIK